LWALWSGSWEEGEVENGGMFRFWAEFFCGQCGHGSSVVGMMLDFVGFVEDFVRLGVEWHFGKNVGEQDKKRVPEGFDWIEHAEIVCIG
jgi:hypothetical protein